MAASTGKLTSIKVVLGIIVVVGLFWGLGMLFATESVFNATAPAGEEFTNSVEVLSKLFGAAVLSWAVATGLAFRNILGNLGLLKAIIIMMGILTVVMFYINLAVATETKPMIWATTVLDLVLFVALLALYPRGQQSAG